MRANRWWIKGEKHFQQPGPNIWLLISFLFHFRLSNYFPSSSSFRPLVIFFFFCLLANGQNSLLLAVRFMPLLCRLLHSHEQQKNNVIAVCMCVCNTGSFVCLLLLLLLNTSSHTRTHTDCLFNVARCGQSNDAEYISTLPRTHNTQNWQQQQQKRPHRNA